MRTLNHLKLVVCAILAMLALTVGVAFGQVPPDAADLAEWAPATDVEVYAADGDTLRIYDDQTWIALQQVTTVGCVMLDVTFNIPQFAAVADSAAQGLVPFEPFRTMYECIDLHRALSDSLTQ